MQFPWDRNDNSTGVWWYQIWSVWHLQYIVASTCVNLFLASGRPSHIWFLSRHFERAALDIPSALCLGWLQQIVSSPFTDSSANRKNTAEIRYQSLKRTSWLFVISNRSFVLTLEAILLLLSATDGCKRDSSWYLKAWGSFRWFGKTILCHTPSEEGNLEGNSYLFEMKVAIDAKKYNTNI